jgi:hypothetical protein
VSWTAGDFPADHAAVLFLAAYPSTGLTNFPGKGLQLWTEFEPAGTSHDISAAVLARMGNLPARWMIFGRLHSLRDDGIRSLGYGMKAIIS